MAPSRALLLVLFIALPLSMCACSSVAGPPERFEYAQIIMGIEARIILYAPNEPTARIAARAAFDRMAELDDVMSDYRDNSELMRACRAAEKTGSASISSDLYRVLEKAQSISTATDGAFDVTIGPLVGLWREARTTRQLPSTQAIGEALARVGWRNMSLKIHPPELRFNRSGMRLDLGGIGKGFAADEAMATLADHDITSCLVDLGGDMLLGDPPPDQKAWRIAIEASGRPNPPLVLGLSRAGIATSGDTEQYVEIAGKRYSHIVDPRTGLGVTSRIAVTVIAPEGATADALASAISVLGPEKGLALLNRFPRTAAMIEVRTDAGIQRFLSDSFPLPANADIQ